MRFAIPMLIFLMTGSVCFGQKFPKTGLVTREELEMATYAPDTSAVAVYLYDRGKLRVEPTMVQGTVLQRYFRIKILSKKGLDYASFRITGPRHSIGAIKGASWRLDNGVVVKTELNAGSFLVTHPTAGQDELTVSFAGVKVGSVLECSYSVSRDRLYYFAWTFQYEIPVMLSEYEMISPSWGQQAHLTGLIPLSKEETDKAEVRRFWQMKNIPAFRREPLMPDSWSWISRLVFTAGSDSWEDVYRKIRSSPSFHQAFTYRSFDDTVKVLTSGTADTLMKIRNISNWIKRTVGWDGTFSRTAGNLKDIVRRRQGSSGDLNFLLIVMLRRAGISADPVFIGTRQNGYVSEDIPTADYFDDVICLLTLGGRDLLLDATEKFLPFDKLPEATLNHRGFRVGVEYYGWIPVEASDTASTMITGTASLSAEGTVIGDLRLKQKGYHAAASRMLRDSLGAADYTRQVARQHQWTLRNASLNLSDAAGEMLEERYDVGLESWATRAGDRTLINPFSLLRKYNTLLAANERVYPIDLPYPEEEILDITLNLPDNAIVEQLPESRIYLIPGNEMRCEFKISTAPHAIRVYVRISSLATFYDASDYPTLHEFNQRLVQKSLENIIVYRN